LSRVEEKEILQNLSKDFKQLNATELSALIKKAPLDARRKLEKPYHKKMRFATQAEDLINEGRVIKAIELLNYAIPLGYFGNEYPYGLLGDAYYKQDDREKALEMYKKSGSIDSLKKIRIQGLE